MCIRLAGWNRSCGVSSPGAGSARCECGPAPFVRAFDADALADAFDLSISLSDPNRDVARWVDPVGAPIAAEIPAPLVEQSSILMNACEAGIGSGIVG